MKKIITIIILALMLIATTTVNAQTITYTLAVSTDNTTAVCTVPQHDTAVTLQENLSKAVDVLMKITAIVQIILAFFVCVFTVMVVVNDCKKKHTKTEWYTIQIKNAIYLRYVCIINATLLFVTMARIIIAQNNNIKMDINTASFSAILMLVYLIWRQSVLKSTRKATTPEDRLMYVMSGKLPEDLTQEDKTENTDNEQSGEQKAMTRMGWANAVTAWITKHKDDPRYLASDKEKIMTLAEASDMAQTFYLQGRKDEKDGLTEYNRVWENIPEE